MPPRKSDVWRAPNGRPLCYHCGKADHLYRNCPYWRLGLRGFFACTPPRRYCNSPKILRITCLSSATSSLPGDSRTRPVSYRVVTECPPGRLTEETSGGELDEDRVLKTSDRHRQGQIPIQLHLLLHGPSEQSTSRTFIDVPTYFVLLQGA
ncbi:hypothetical protein HPB50_005789 [Hyalomma asiaticum]|uniref:Uncharacterized protein n=1 Tax=Hyalomma asiaticum TaxID=266040 RepID=A0ACB7SXV4_HYAAI|nr:hypothetical protein HPB50_005789 [Hyalomma asiaticum]